MSEEIKIDSELALAEFVRDIRKQWYETKYLKVKVTEGRTRTLTENNCVHLFCEMLADVLNASGLDMREVIREDVNIPWDMPSVKKHLWKPIQKAVIDKAKTSEADRGEYSKVYEILAHHMAAKLGVTVPEWPSKESQQKQSAA